MPKFSMYLDNITTGEARKGFVPTVPDCVDLDQRAQEPQLGGWVDAVLNLPVVLRLVVPLATFAAICGENGREQPLIVDGRRRGSDEALQLERKRGVGHGRADPRC